MSAPTLTLVPALWALSACHAGAGPVVGYAIDRGPLVGWEAAGGWTLARGAVGGSYRFLQDPAIETANPEDGEAGDVEAAHYLAWEPGAIAGATLGAGLAAGEVSFAYGAWLGSPLPLELDTGTTFGTWDPLLSVAIGWRYLGGAHEIYAAPKFYVAELPRWH